MVLYIFVGFKSIRVAIFYAGLPKPNATLLLYPGLGPAMLRRLRRESLPVSIGGVPQSHTSIPQTRRAHHGNNSRSKQGCIDLYLSLASKRFTENTAHIKIQ